MSVRTDGFCGGDYAHWAADTEHERDLEREPRAGRRRPLLPLNPRGSVRVRFEKVKP